MTQKAATGRMNRHVAWVRSMTSDDTEYQIVRRPNGDLKCACLGWAFDKEHRPKWCKHIGVLGHVQASPAARTVAIEETQAVYQNERFNVRGIVFEGRV